MSPQKADPTMKFIDQNVYFPPHARQPQRRVSESNQAIEETAFLFVNSKKGQTPQKSRSSLRSHVMQQARSKRKWSTSKGVTNTSAATLRHSSASKSNREGDSIGVKASKGATQLSRVSEPVTPVEMPADTLSISATALVSSSGAPPPSLMTSNHTACHSPHSVGDGDHFGRDWYFLDPYCSLPVKLDALSRGMLDQYLLSLNECLSLSGKAQFSISHAWFVAAFASRAFLYSLLCAAATHLYALGRVSYYTILQHKTSTMNELNATLHDPVLSVTDGNIGAVFNLMCVDEAFPMAIEAQCPNRDLGGVHPNQKRMHSNGLKQMVRVRGGLLNLRHNHCLVSFLLWHATMHSTVSFQPSGFFPCPNELVPVLDQLSWSISRAGTPKRLPRLLLASRSPGRLVVAARHVTALTRQTEAWLAEDPKAPSSTQLRNFSGIIIQSLLQFLNSQTEFDPMSEAVATAMVMFVVRKSNDVTPLFDPLHFAATDRLRHGLRHALDADWDPDVRLWVSTVGAICAEGSPEALEIDHAFVWACQAWGVRTLQQLLEALKDLLWIESRFGQGARHLWVRLKGRILHHDGLVA